MLMTYSPREQAMIRQYERSLVELQATIDELASTSSEILAMNWWTDEVQLLTLQLRTMRHQLPSNYAPPTAKPSFSD